MSDFKEVPTEQLLSFQEFTPVHEASFTNSQLNVNLTKEPNDFNDYSHNVSNERLNDISSDNEDSPKSFWTLDYYQQLFDVDTTDVVERILASFIPRRDSLFKNKIRIKPDLYGPLWISITLVFAIAISGNIAAYFIDTKHAFRYNFRLVSYAATAIYIYIGIVPIILWGFLKWTSDNTEALDIDETSPPNLLELICIYGYSIFIYVPISILWTIHFSWLQWSLVIIGALLSGLVLLYRIMPGLNRTKYKIPLVIGVSMCHLLLAAGFKLYFFHMP